MSIKTYKVLLPIGFGGRQEKGAIVEMEESHAKAFGSEYLVEVKEGEMTTENTSDNGTSVDETSLDEMSLSELKAKAKEMKLDATGSKADLRERITIALA